MVGRQTEQPLRGVQPGSDTGGWKRAFLFTSIDALEQDQLPVRGVNNVARVLTLVFLDQRARVLRTLVFPQEQTLNIKLYHKTSQT